MIYESKSKPKERNSFKKNGSSKLAKRDGMAFLKSQSIYKTVASTEQAHAAQLTILVINDG